MKKRSLVLLLCLALVALVAVNDTLATTAKGWFKDLTQALGLDAPTHNPQALDVDIVTSNSGVLTPAHYDDSFDWSKVDPVKKTTYAQNAAEKDAFVRICIAVKNAPGVLYHQMPSNVVSYAEHIDKEYEIGSETFTLYTFDYKGKLAKGESTPSIVMDFALDKSTTNEDLADLGADFVRVQTFAIEADAFAQLNEAGEKITDQSTDKTPMSPTTALNNALGDINTFNPFN